MFSIRPAEAQIALEAWTRENRGVDNLDQPTRVTRGEFEGLFSLLQASKSLEDLGGLPFAIVSVEIEEQRSDIRTGAARVRLSTPDPRWERSLTNLQATENLDFSDRE